jgi:DNA transformation protein
MSGSREFAEHVASLLEPLGDVELRRFFGGWALRRRGVQFAMMMDAVYLKAEGELRAELERAGSEPFTFVRAGREVVTSYWSVPDEAIDRPELLLEYARRATDLR